MEVTNISDVSRRTAVAVVVSELSHFRTIASHKDRLRGEVEAALHARFGRPMFPHKVRPFDTGVSYAFGGQDGPIARIAARDPQHPLAARPDATALAELERLLNRASEYMLLRGPRPEDIVQMPDYDRGASHKIAKERVKRCARCEEPFVAGDTRENYCGARCRNTMVKRRYRAWLRARARAERGEG